MVASTKYQGLLNVSFPVAHGKLIVRTGASDANSSAPASSATNWLAKLNPLNKDSSAAAQKGEDPSARKYNAVNVVWPYANVAPGEEGRVCKVQSEREWWGLWELPIRTAVLGQRRGKVTAEDWMEGVMGVVGQERAKPWGVGQQW